MNKRNFLKTGLAALASTAIPAAAAPHFDANEFFYLNGGKGGTGFSMRVFSDGTQQARNMFVTAFKRFERREGTGSLQFTKFDPKSYEETVIPFEEVKRMLGFAKNEPFRLEHKNLSYQLTPNESGILVMFSEKGVCDAWSFYKKPIKWR